MLYVFVPDLLFIYVLGCRTTNSLSVQPKPESRPSVLVIHFEIIKIAALFLHKYIVGD